MLSLAIYIILALHTSKKQSAETCALIIASMSLFGLLTSFSLIGIILLFIDYFLALIVFKLIKNYEDDVLMWLLSVVGGLFLIMSPSLAMDILNS